ncbi:hypothetical protein J2S34_003744 [Nitrobacter winogradskyi]|uniref:Uncharacterized protein n=1 Tax=Nitrobacter winogradskyi TaxID=913 RepID=A0ACC6AP41_NITWI|nr:hypothetical protein [Nitrobacter winogradskyi]
MPDRSQNLSHGGGLANHILPISGTMIGARVTLVGLVKIADKSGQNHVDEYAALAAISFLASALVSDLSIRYAQKRLGHRLNKPQPDSD